MPKLTQWAEDNLAEGFTVFALPSSHRRRLRTTNLVDLDDESYAGIHEFLKMLGMMFDNGVLHQFGCFIDAFPCYPRLIDPDGEPAIHVDTSMRYLYGPADLRQILQFLTDVRLH
jgi:hypothetical protein